MGAARLRGGPRALAFEAARAPHSMGVPRSDLRCATTPERAGGHMGLPRRGDSRLLASDVVMDSPGG